MRLLINTSDMKKSLVFFILFSIIFLNGIISFGFVRLKTDYAYACDYVEVKSVNKSFKIDIGSNPDISLLRQNVNKKSREEQLAIIQQILNMGFSLKDALCYVYPNLMDSINCICQSLLILPQEPIVSADNNNCKIIFKTAKNGVKVNENALFYDFYENIKTNSKIDVKFNDLAPQKTLEQLKKEFVLVSQFKTSFKNSTETRKHNIRQACSVINGQFIKSGNTFSFNSVTGPRTQENGYKEAKIIKDGAYADGYGGGVCQVSSTLYNACILAGLDILEVHNHSLPTSYVDPGFDAMVNVVSADLKIKNNTGAGFIITSSTLNDECCICIYGVRPKYTIATRYHKYKELPAGEDVLETDVSKYNKENLIEGRNRIISPIDGYKVKGYLDYYIDGILVKSVLVRDNTYNPRKGVVIVVERSETE